jgi:hypothetical protein
LNNWFEDSPEKGTIPPARIGTAALHLQHLQSPRYEGFCCFALRGFEAIVARILRPKAMSPEVWG